MIQFREIEDDDVEAVVALWNSCGLTRPWNDPYKDISLARGAENSAVLVGACEGRLVASVMVGHDGHRGALYYVAVAPEFRGRGFGKAAVREAESWLAWEDVTKINILVRAENEAVRGFYEKLGYEINPVMCMGRKIEAEER